MNFNFKTFIQKIHLWLGLVTAPLVFFICITGTIIVFSDEIMELSAGKARFVKEVKDVKLENETLLNILGEKYPDRRISYEVCYRNPERSIRFNTFSRENGLRMVYMDPYTGDILKDDTSIYFFYIMAHLHGSLMWHGTGEWIIDIATIIFLLALITGLVLWWPKKWDKKHKTASFTIKWKASGKRINLDLHKVFGFYGLGICLIISLTGLLIAFKPLANVTKNAFGGNASIDMRELFATKSTDSTKTVIPLNQAIDQAFETFPAKKQVQVYTFWIKDWGYYVMNVANKIGLKSAMNAEFVAYEKNSGKQFDAPAEFLINKKVDNAYWMLHMGNYLGLFGKIITFIGGLTASMLPVTGFIIWLNNRKRKRKN